MCAILLWAFNWLTCYRLPYGRYQSMQPGLCLPGWGGEMGWKEKKATEERYRSVKVCIEFQVYLTFQTAGIITAVLMSPCFVFLLPPCTVLLSQPCVEYVCVSVCMLELQIKPKLSCFDCSLRVPAAQGPSAERRTHARSCSVALHSSSAAVLLSGAGISKGNSPN